MVEIEQDSCRICLSITQTTERQDLFLEEGSLSAVGALYEEVLNLPIGNNAIIRYICNYCDLQLKLFRELKNKALDTHKFLSDISEAIDDIPTKPSVTVECDDFKEIECEDFKEIDCEDFKEIECDGFKEIQITETDLSQNEDLDVDTISNEDDAYNFSDEDQYEIMFLEENAIEKAKDEAIEKDDGLEEREDEIKENELDVRVADEIIENEINNPTREEDLEEYFIESDETRSEFENLSTHEMKEIFPCHHCGQNFSHKTQLRIHRMKQHPRTKKFNCPLCSKVMFSEEALQAHLNIHNGLPAYTCDICQNTFNQKVHYNYHMLHHKNERNIICDICQKGYLSKGDLKIHMRVHTDERRYKCDICGKTFRAHTHMINHRYSHFDKQFECPECHQKYVSPNTLRTHFKAVHDAEVPFECKFCEKKFKRKHHLHAHYKTHANMMVILEETDSNDVVVS